VTVGREAMSGSTTPTRSFDMSTYHRCSAAGLVTI
jgi:hypothetical protein